MGHCIKCGTSLSASDVFCGNCGEPAGAPNTGGSSTILLGNVSPAAPTAPAQPEVKLGSQQGSVPPASSSSGPFVSVTPPPAGGQAGFGGASPAGGQSAAGGAPININVSNVAASGPYGAESRFDGGVLDFWGTGVVVYLMIVCTFGIAMPWALSYYQRYLTSHTIVDGRRLYFDGTGGQLFGTWLKIIGLSIITFGIYGAFWGQLEIQRWVVRHTHVL